MKKQTGLLVAVAAFAVTVSGTYAANEVMLREAGLNDDQIAAFELARELREEGDREGARNALLDAGIDDKTMHELRDTLHELQHDEMQEVRTAIENADYEAFLAASADSPFADVITSEEDFETLVEAHSLMEDGDRDGAIALFEELGLERPGKGMGGHHSFGHGMMRGHLQDELSDEQLAAFKAAKEANDKDAMTAILEEAGLTTPGPRDGR